MGEEIIAAREEEEEEKRDQRAAAAEEGGTSPSSHVSLLKIEKNRKKKAGDWSPSIGKRDIKANFVFLPRTTVLTLRYIVYII